MNIKEFLKKTEGQHGFWLSNHEELIEDQVASLVNIHGEDTALRLINTTGSGASNSLYKTIKTIREKVEANEHNANHEDDYFNAGGFFAHWDQYSRDEKLEMIGAAL